MDQAAESRLTSRASSPLPTGTVTFLFTDIEGSTERWERNREAMNAALAQHDAVLSAAIEANGGYVFKKMGDAYCAAFRTAPEAVRAAVQAQQAIAEGDFSAVNGLRVRMAVHTGYAEERDRDYFGPSVNRASRLLGIGHGGQMLVSAAASDLVQGELPAQTSLRALGAHRLKDLAHPEQVFQLVAAGLASDFPPPRSLDSLPNNLPLQVTSFVGRDEDVSEVKQLLGKTRLLTLTGSGGVGKTRLALQVGAEVLEEHPDGVWLVDLAGLQDSDLVVSQVASVLGVRVGADRSLSDSIVYALKPKRALIILDNCEHLVTAAAHVAGAIIKGAPNVRVLTTSREGLGIAGETIYRVNSLAVPKTSAEITVATAGQFGALALFMDRATAANTRFAPNDTDARTVADICRSLDGIPFAIELAAARVKLMTVTHLAERLSERFRILTGGDRTALPRQQTMRALVDWSYNLLNERERAILNRTAVFAGGWTLEAASDICADERLEGWEVLDLLSSLVDKSLVVVELGGATERYRLLETTWQYAREKLAAAGESVALNRKHAERFLGVAEAADASNETTPKEKWVAGLEPELDNFRAAMGWALVGKHDVALGAKMAAALRDVWIALGSRIEGLRWINLALDASGDAEPDATAIKLWLGLCINTEGFGETALDAAQRAVAHAQRLGDQHLLALALTNHGFALDRRGRIDEAQTVYLQAVPLLRECGARSQLARVLSWWSITHFVRGESQEASQGFSEALALAKAVDDIALTATVLGNIAELAFAEGNAAKAVAVAEESATLRHRFKNPAGLANVYCNLTAYRLSLGDAEAAKANARVALQNAREGQSTNMLMCVTQHAALIKARGGDAGTAARLLGYVNKMFAESGFSREPTEQWSYEQLMQELRSGLKDGEIEALGLEGAGWTEDQVFEEARRL